MPNVRIVRQRTEAIEREARDLRGELAGLRKQTDDLLRFLGRARTALGFVGAALVVATFVALVLLSIITGKFWWATSITLTVFLAACGIAWATRRGVKWAIGALIFVGASTALWATVYGAAPHARNKLQPQPSRASNR